MLNTLPKEASMMQVQFEARSREAAHLRDLVQSRARFVMRRMAWGLPRMNVRMTDLNGPRGGIDKQCRVELRTLRGGPMVVTAVARDWRTALDTALARATHALRRLWRRMHRPARRSAPALAVAHRDTTTFLST
jgi:hypothetical protein